MRTAIVVLAIVAALYAAAVALSWARGEGLVSEVTP